MRSETGNGKCQGNGGGMGERATRNNFGRRGEGRKRRGKMKGEQSNDCGAWPEGNPFHCSIKRVGSLLLFGTVIGPLPL